ncbi:Nucleolar GTP-binding protein 1 [Mycoblastus sanguinarius]|nr:Nucleolar GTP-binding protein 1 [Mycoblastus sanguinarius]
MKTSWKDIAPVPTSQEFLDVVLSRTQRRLPTQIRSGFKISRIRGFYTRKVRYTQETFTEKLSLILDGFPRLQDIHPFHKDLLNTLYDADHFRIALGQLSTAKHLIETVSRDYVRLLKCEVFDSPDPEKSADLCLLDAQSLFQCKQLKRAALGRMSTICRRLRDPLVYLEQVRQHLGRLPSIDPNTRTLLICGYPNGQLDPTGILGLLVNAPFQVGKSSFIRSITRADVDVQPYAFTTKSLFVGHFDYKYLRFQAIDTPGLLDHPLEDMNPIEMTSITAIAHLRSCILYFMDLSEQCGYSVQAQIQLFQSIKPLFANKIVFVVINKIDVMKPEQLDSETKAMLDSMLKAGDIELLQLSCTTTEGVSEVKNAACERLIADRVAQKLKAGTNSSGSIGGRLGDVLTRIHVAQPLGGIVRETYIPEAVKTLRKFSKDDPSRPRLARDIEEENGGAGVYNVNLKDSYKLNDESWKYDRVPEVFDGKNVYDFIDPDIENKLAALESEEERFEAEGFYNSDTDDEDADEANIRMKADLIREKRKLIRNEARMRKSLKNRAVIPRPSQSKKLSVMEDHLDSLGFDTTTISARARSQSRGRSTLRSRAETEDAMDVDTPTSNVDALRAKSRARSQSNRREDGVTSVGARNKAERLAKLGQKKMNRMARQGEADRHTTAALPKHLFSGKRGMGKTQRR